MAGRRKQAEVEAPKIGHNSNMTDEERRSLAGYVQEIERVDAEMRQMSSDRGLIYKSAKEKGFDTKALRRVIADRRIEKSKLDELEHAMDAYKSALGMLADTPLGEASIHAAARNLAKMGATVSVDFADAPFHAPDAPR